MVGLALAAGLAVSGCVPQSGVAAPAIPANYLALYQQWGHVCPNVDWAVLAGVGEVESDHGRYDHPGVTSGENEAGARGPMQFMPATYAAVRRAHPELKADLYNPVNAIPAASYLLCSSGAARSLSRAIYAYNHSWSYVDKVKSTAAAYRRMPASALTAPKSGSNLAAGQ